MRYLLSNIHPIINRFKLYPNLFFYITLYVIFLFVFAGFKLFLKKQSKSGEFSLLIYFFLIGAGFIINELFLIQRISIILGNPLTTTPFILFSIFFGCGLGAVLSKKLHIQNVVFSISIQLIIIAIITFIYGLPMQTLLSYIYRTSPLIRYSFAILFILSISVLSGSIFTLSIKFMGKSENPVIPIYLASNAFGFVWGGFLFLFAAPNIGYGMMLVLNSIIYLSSSFCIGITHKLR
ncbi:MAG: hypothetical protein HY934_06755 [Candidatus Firestonebacteria bacterium]|nr:hypothetical protein [Candidatus Firestonebacteria bacterium]